MQIIIVGCGKVGRTLAEQLQEENTDLTLIDISADKINSISDDIDALYVIGNGASINTLMEAGIETADLLIAVTASDELNLLCCLIAQKTGHCHTIARVLHCLLMRIDRDIDWLHISRINTCVIHTG